MRNFSTLSAAIVLLVLSACASSRDVEGELSGCGSCHPANPHASAIGSHGCNECHATSIAPGFATSVIGPDAGGTHADGFVSVRAHDPAWIATGASGVTSHGMAALYRNKAAYPAGMDGCRSCHGASLNAGVLPGVTSCDTCHQPYALPGTAATDWRTDCTFCHGDRTRAPSNLRAAPPRDVDGAVASARTGAHQVHLAGKAVSSGVACEDCHGGTARALPGDFVHANGTTEVTLKRPGDTVATGAYDPVTGTCSNTYCHGNLARNPKAGNSPSWIATTGQSSCDSCHAPNGALTTADAATDRHGAHMCNACHVTSTHVGCFGCHDGYQRAFETTPAVVNPALHVDGLVEVLQTTAPLFKGVVIHTAFDPVTRSCTTDCHDIGWHRTYGAPVGSVTW